MYTRGNRRTRKKACSIQSGRPPWARMIVRSGKSTATSSMGIGSPVRLRAPGEDGRAGVDHHRQLQPLGFLVERAQRVEAAQVRVGLDGHVRRVQLERAHAHVRGAAHVRRRVLGEARVHAAHRDQPVGRGRAVFGHVFVHARREAHEVRARVVDEHRAVDPLRVELAQQVGRAAVDLLDLVEVRAPAADDLEHGGLQLPPWLDMDVRVGDGHMRGDAKEARRQGDPW